jgi:hypothetical protein
MSTLRVASLRRWSLCFALSLCSLPAPARSQAVRPDAYATNGVVRASALAGNVLYIGGDFTWVGYPTGPCALVDRTSGAPSPAFPLLDAFSSIVHAAVPDGAGGWYVAGEFSYIGGIARQNLAHILANNTVAPWAPNPDGPVYSLLLRGSSLVVGGSFTTIGFASRNNLAAVSVTGSGLATAWNPDIDGTVQALAANATTIFAGGVFTTVGAATRFSLAAIDEASAVAVGSWNPQVFGLVQSMALSDTTLYVGGQFTAVGGATVYTNAFAIGSVSGTFHAWSPAPDGNVQTMAVSPSGDELFVGGGFSNVGGRARAGLAVLDRVTGNARSDWNPDPDGPVQGLAAAGRTVYAVGGFTKLGTVSRLRIAAIDSLTGKPQAWSPNADEQLEIIVVSGSNVFVGGSLLVTSVGGVERARAAAIDVNTGRALPWDPNVDATVESIAVQGSSVYLGGLFTTVGGQLRPYAAAVHRVTGALRAGWQPAPDGEVLAFAPSGGVTYVGGSFATIGGQPRSTLAALDTTTGLANSWNPAPGPPGGTIVTALVTSGTTVFVGGAFSTIGGQPRVSLAEIGSNGLATSWKADVIGFVSALALSHGNLYVCGNFSLLGSQPREGLGSVGVTSAAVSAWNPNPNGPVLTLAAVGDTVYVGGFYSGIGGALRNFLAAIGPGGTSTAWDVEPDGPVYSIAATPYNVYISGDYGLVGGVRRTNLAFAGAGSGVTGVGDTPIATPRATLTAVAPNPFLRATRVRFTLPQAARVTLELLDVAGRRVQALVDGALLAPGPHELELSAAGLPAGLYFCRLEAGGVRSTAKLVHME